MINVKPNVVFHPETWKNPAMWQIIQAVVETSPSGYTPTITSGVEGRHSVNPWSKHYTGEAIDFRIRDFTGSPQLWAEAIEKKLGDEYFVLLELTHLHIHWRGE